MKFDFQNMQCAWSGIKIDSNWNLFPTIAHGNYTMQI